MVTTITKPTTREILPLGNAYRYDQLNRLIESRSFATLNLATNTWNAASTYNNKYFNQFKYDANGNILEQLRNNNAGLQIDKLTYKYKRNPSGKLVQNRLYHVNDATSATSFADDIDDMGTFDASLNGINVNNNYRYDQEGRLIYDKQEDIENIEWRVDGKVLKITRPIGSSKKNIIFEYDAMGHRIAKHVLTSSDVLEKSTYYILDASGNTMSVYERAINEVAQTVDYYQAENHIYGSSRLGVMDRHISMLGLTNYNANSTVITHQIGKRTYELANHLGNVLSVISDKPIPHVTSGTIDYYMANIRVAQDYSPFGVVLDGRNFTVGEKYRYSLQAQEHDDEVKGDGNCVNYKYRMHDPRLGRFFAVDPLHNDYPWNSPYAFSENLVINAVELEGLESKISIQPKNYDKPILYKLEPPGPLGEGTYSIVMDSDGNACETWTRSGDNSCRAFNQCQIDAERWFPTETVNGQSSTDVNYRLEARLIEKQVENSLVSMGYDRETVQKDVQVYQSDDDFRNHFVAFKDEKTAKTYTKNWEGSEPSSPHKSNKAYSSPVIGKSNYQLKFYDGKKSANDNVSGQIGIVKEGSFDHGREAIEAIRGVNIGKANAEGLKRYFDEKE